MARNAIEYILPIFLLFSSIRGDYSVQNAFSNMSFTDPVGIYDAGDGTDRLFVIEQSGIIKVFSNDPNTTSVQIFLNITSIVDQDPGYTEEGLLGLAFHPNFSENGYFYVNYTDYNPKRNVIARYTVSESDPNHADDIVAVTDEQFVVLKLRYPDIETLGFYSFPLDYFD